MQNELLLAVLALIILNFIILNINFLEKIILNVLELKPSEYVSFYFKGFKKYAISTLISIPFLLFFKIFVGKGLALVIGAALTYLLNKFVFKA
jgi:hypothetical protein